MGGLESTRGARLAAAAALVLAAAAASAQGYRPLPSQQCSYHASLRIAGGSPVSPAPFDVLLQLDQVRGFCEEAVREMSSPRLLGHLAYVRALAGDAPGALAAAREGAALGAGTAQVLLGVMHAQGAAGLARDYGAARELFERAAKADHPYASFNLGILAANGWGVPAEASNAARGLGAAARRGDPLAMQIFGERYDAGRREQWWREAAEALYPDAKSPLRLADLGQAAPDVPALLAFYERQARAGEPWAQAYVGMLHEAGQWLPEDAAAAAAWYRRAADAGNVPAQWRLTRLYREGRGVARDEAEAKRWAERPQVQRCEALERGSPGVHACDRLAAERYDPQREAAGVDSYCMRHFATRAVAACTQAVKAAPKSARYRAQLARALAHTGRFQEARREAAAAAAAGSSAAMVLMGAMSERGLGAPRDDAAALAWYLKAGELGNVRARALASRAAQQGVGVGAGSTEAARILDRMVIVTAAQSSEERAQTGSAAAQHNLAARLEQERRYDEAMVWYERAAAQGYAVSALNLAQMYELGIGVKPDRAEAMRRYRLLARHGEREARYRLARLAAGGGEYAEALPLYRLAVADGDTRAMLDLGELYEHGRGVARDMRAALALYEQAAGTSRWASAKLGAFYLTGGDGIPADFAKAELFLRRAADAGHAGATNNLGVMRERGLGGPKDLAAAHELYHAALELGSGHGKGNLEAIYAQGRGAPADAAAAADWYRRGAKAGIAAAQYRLGLAYEEGRGVARDERQALYWYHAALAQGHGEARRRARVLLHAQGDQLGALLLGEERARPAPPWPQGIDPDPGEDMQRKRQVRVAASGEAQGAGLDASLADPYDIVRWFPETDGKAKPE